VGIVDYIYCGIFVLNFIFIIPIGVRWYKRDPVDARNSIKEIGLFVVVIIFLILVVWAHPSYRDDY